MGIDISLRQIVVLTILITVIILGMAISSKIKKIGENTLNEIPSPYEKTLRVYVDPQSSQEGTKFLITTELKQERESQNFDLRIETEGYSTTVTLYDDGSHFDGEPRDKVFGGFFDSTNKPLGTYTIKKRGNENLASFKIYKPGCEEILGQAKSDRINFIILPSNYENYEDFKKDSIEILKSENSLMNFEPFKSNKGAFSFSIVNATKNLDCEIGCSGIPNAVCCDSQKVLDEASQCNFDSIFILINSEKYCGSSTSYAKICAKNEFSKLILVHEIGHSFAGLADEYLYEEQYGNYDVGEIDAPNCAREGCEKWKNTTEGCFKGCSYSDLYRPAEKESIMYTFYPSFNTVSENHIEKLILNQIKENKKIEKLSPKKESYFVNAGYSGGKVIIKNIFLKPIDSRKDLKPSGYAAVIESSTGESLFETNLSIPNTVYLLPGDNHTPINLDDFEFSFTLPYNQKSKTLKIFYKEELLDETSLSVFSNTCGDKSCGNSENHLNCQIDCKIEEDNFCEESKCDPDCESQKNCEKVKNSIYVFFILLVAFFIGISYYLLSKKSLK